MEENYIEWLVKRKDPVYAGKDPDDRCVRVISTGSTADVIGNSDLGGSSSGYVFCFSEFECRI